MLHLEINFRPIWQELVKVRSACAAWRNNPLWEISPAQQGLYGVFVDFKKVFDRIWHTASWEITKKYNISANIIWVIKNLYDKATSAILFNSSIEN